MIRRMRGHDETRWVFVANYSKAAGYLGEVEAFAAYYQGSSLSLPYESVCAALGPSMPQLVGIQNTWRSTAGMVSQPYYIQPAGSPFGPQGDPDGDGVTNLGEYEYVLEVGGTREDFVTAALDDSEPSSSVPVLGPIVVTDSFDPGDDSQVIFSSVAGIRVRRAFSRS